MNLQVDIRRTIISFCFMELTKSSISVIVSYVHKLETKYLFFIFKH